MRHKLLLLLLTLALGLGILTAGPAQAAPPAGLTAALQATAGRVTASDRVVVTVDLRNDAASSARLKRSRTPDAPGAARQFTVTKDGVARAYVGALYKLSDAANEQVSIAPGQVKKYTVDLTGQFDFSESGTYQVSFATQSDAAAKVASNTVSIDVAGRKVSTQSMTITAVSGSTNFSNCSSTQMSGLIAARTQAATYADAAKAYLTRFAMELRYNQWFGVDDATRLGTVRSHFTSISAALNTATVGFVCDANSPYYAYVYPSNPYVIYLGAAFWAAPLAGLDSRGGTLIHEMSHFTVNGGTDDYVYGYSGASQLAVSTPSQAIMNADNHEYFAENPGNLPDPAVTLAKGAAVGAGYYYSVSIKGFSPSSTIYLTCRDASRPNGFATGTVTTSSSGVGSKTTLCSSDRPGDHWANSSNAFSNKVAWASRVAVAKGASAAGTPGCTSSACAYLTVATSGLPGTTHTVRCFSSLNASTPFAAFTTTAATTSLCRFGVAGKQVWATVDGIRSWNTVTW